MSNATPNNPKNGSPAQCQQSTDEMPDCETVLDRLGTVVDPRFRDDIVSLGLVDGVKITEEQIAVEIGLYAPRAPEEGFLIRDVHDALKRFGVEVVTLATGPPSGSSEYTSTEAASRTRIPGVRNVVPFVGTDEGAGTTTTALNTALALAGRGAHVGLLQLDQGSGDLYQWIGRRPVRDTTEDCDPVRPTMYGADTVPPVVRGLRVLSPETYRRETGDRFPDSSADGMVERLCYDVGWGGLDYLFVDVPVEQTVIGDAFFDRVETAGAVVTMSEGCAETSLRDCLERIKGAGTIPLGVVQTSVGSTIVETRQSSDLDTDRAVWRRTTAPLLGRVPWSSTLSGAGGPRSIEPDHDLRPEFDDIAANAADAVGAIQRREHSIRRLTSDRGDLSVTCQLY